MRIRVYQSDKGDCLLLTSRTGAHMLVDGGMREAFKAHVRPDLAAMAQQGQALDLVYVSHIDQDHISGILELLDNTMTWRVHDFRKAAGLSTKTPGVPRMPKIGGIWHNAFSMLLKDNAAGMLPFLDVLHPVRLVVRRTDVDTAVRLLDATAASDPKSDPPLLS